MRSIRRRRTAAFTLVEVLVSSAIVVVMVGFLLTVTDQTARIWTSTAAKVEQFREARSGFERVTTRLAQATLNTYWDYDSATAPTRYERRSELRFVADSATSLLGTSGTTTRITHAVFFNAPMGFTATDADRGLANALNALGYFVEFGDDTAQRPAFITTDMLGPRWRFRLMEFAQPTEKFSLYQFTNGNPGAKTTAWFTADVNSTAAAGMKRVVAENVIAFIITPRLAKAEELPLQSNPTHSPLAPAYSYDSTNTNANPLLNPRNQLPPVVQLTMVAIDDRSAEKLGLDSTKSDVFEIVKSKLFTNTANFTDDLATLEATLAQKKVRYRIFTTNVHIRAAKWSREQAN
jgi:uncharacterized protein (TIGR02599 family)